MGETVTAKYLLRSFSVAILLLGLVELTFQVLPASDGPYTTFDKSFPVLKFDSSKQLDGFRTAGNLAQRKTRWHINNMGWNSPYDYNTTGDKPVIAIIGNSYVEGFPVDVDKGLASSLQNKLSNNYDCYGFGYSGSKLSQYLNISRYVQHTFHPKVMIFTLVDADVIGSIAPPGQPPQYTLFFQNSPSGLTETPIREFIPSWIKRTHGKLGLVRYFNINKQLPFSDQGSSKSETLSPDEIATYNKVTEYAFGRIRSENPDTTVLILLDAPRKDIYRGKILDRSLQSRTIISDVSHKYGFHVLDLTKPMSDLYNVNHASFSFGNDYHWNNYGFAVVTDQVDKYLRTSGIVKDK